MKTLLAITVLLLIGCADIHTPQDFGYDYTHVTPMGIKYRVDIGAAPLDPDELDYYFRSVMNCMAQTFEPGELLVISTTGDANPDREDLAEGWTWGRTPGHPAMTVLNTTHAQALTYPLLTHEYIHVIAVTDGHNNEAFLRCGEAPWGLAGY